MARVLAFTPTYGDGPDPSVRGIGGGAALGWELVWEVGRRNPFPPPDLRNIFCSVCVCAGVGAGGRVRRSADGRARHGVTPPRSTDCGVRMATLVYGVYKVPTWDGRDQCVRARGAAQSRSSLSLRRGCWSGRSGRRGGGERCGLWLHADLAGCAGANSVSAGRGQL